MNHLDDVTQLNDLCDKYGSDKGSNLPSSPVYTWPAHTYTEVYSSLFVDLKDKPLVLFECGLGTNNTSVPSNMGVTGKPGASLRVWRDYFSNAVIYGADIDSGVLFEEDRIKTGYLDQTDPKTIHEYWDSFGNFTPDIVIDDGLHTFPAAVVLFEAVWPKLASGGLYIIEDVAQHELGRFSDWMAKTPGNSALVSLTRRGLPLRDNTLAVFRKD